MEALLGLTLDDDRQPTQVTDAYWLMCTERNPAGADAAAEGKWILFYKRAQLDAAWACANEKYRAGELPGVSCMKVSTNRLNPNSSDPSTGVVIFYCGKTTDPQGTKAVGNTILHAMAYTGGGCNRSTKQIHWKSDEQTRQGAYSNRGRAASTFRLSYASIRGV